MSSMGADHFSSALETPGNEPSLSRSQRWRGRLQRLRARARPVALFASGVAAAFLTLLLYHVLVPPPALSARVYEVIQPSLVLVQAQAPGADGTVEHDLGSGVIVDNQMTRSASQGVYRGGSSLSPFRSCSAGTRPMHLPAPRPAAASAGAPGLAVAHTAALNVTIPD